MHVVQQFLAWLGLQAHSIGDVISAAASNRAIPAQSVLMAQGELLVALLAVWGISKITKAVRKLAQ